MRIIISQKQNTPQNTETYKCPEATPRHTWSHSIHSSFLLFHIVFESNCLWYNYSCSTRTVALTYISTNWLFTQAEVLRKPEHCPNNIWQVRVQEILQTIYINNNRSDIRQSFSSNKKNKWIFDSIWTCVSKDMVSECKFPWNV